MSHGWRAQRLFSIHLFERYVAFTACLHPYLGKAHVCLILIVDAILNNLNNIYAGLEIVSWDGRGRGGGGAVSGLPLLLLFVSIKDVTIRLGG